MIVCYVDVMQQRDTLIYHFDQFITAHQIITVIVMVVGGCWSPDGGMTDGQETDTEREAMYAGSHVAIHRSAFWGGVHSIQYILLCIHKRTLAQKLYDLPVNYDLSLSGFCHKNTPEQSTKDRQSRLSSNSW